MSITTWQNRAGRGVIGRMVAEIEELRAELEKVTREAHENKDKARWVNAELERIKSQEPAWFACDTEGAEFDITFVTSREEAADLVDYALADDPDLKFEDLVTPLYAAAVQAQPLTNNEWFAFWLKCDQVDYESAFPDFLLLARAIEARFGIKAPS